MGVLIITSNKTNIEGRIRPLIPLDDIDISVYEEVLDYAIGDDKINNIAMTSPYGGGKSSVIRSYEKKQKVSESGVEEFIYIPILELDEGSEMEENEIERRIIEYFMNKLEHYSFMNSKFKLIGQETLIPLENRWLVMLPFITTIIYFIINKITSNNKWETFITSEINKNILNIVSGITIILSPLIAILIIDLIKNSTLTRYLKNIKIWGIQLEIPEEDSEETIISVNRSDVLYLLSKIKSENRVIVFEDIDRFGKKKVFNDLRELNYLANVNRPKDQKLKFIYLIKDDLFNSKEQAKFFDLIIPILPVIDKSNSYEQLMNIIEETGSKGIISDSYIMEVSLYLDDMRLMHNVINEYYIYLERLNAIKEREDKLFNEEQLFSIVLYKSLCPKDFDNLHKHESFINYVFDYINQNIEDSFIQGELGDYGDALEKILEEGKDSKFIKDIIENKIGKKNETIKKEIEKSIELIIFFIREKHINESYMDYIVDSNNSYLSSRDKKFIRSILDRNYLDYTYKLNDPYTIISVISKRLSHEKIFNHYLTSEIIVLDDNDENNKIKKSFYNNIKSRKSYDYIYNYIEYILNIEEKSDIISQFDKKILITNFIKFIHIEKNFFDNFLDEGIFRNKKIEVLNHIVLLMIIDDLQSILELEKEYNDFKTIVEDNSLLCNQLLILIEKLDLKDVKNTFISNINRLNIKFKTIDSSINDQAFDIIYNNNLYEYNEGNIGVVLDRIKIKVNENTRILTDVKNSEIAIKFIEYSEINKNKDVLIEYILDNINENYIKDEEHVVVEILNSDVDFNLKETYIDRLGDSIEDISKVIKDDVIELLTQKNLISFRLKNLLYLYNVKENINTSEIANYINNQYEDNENTSILSKEYYAQDLSDSIYKFFIWSLEIGVTENFIINFIELFNEIKISNIEELNLNKINKDIIQVLIEYNIIDYSINNYVKIKNNYSITINRYILNHIDKFINDLKEGEIDCDNNILKDLLEEEIDDYYKFDIVDMFTENTLEIGDMKLSNSVNLYVLENKLFVQDLINFVLEHKEGQNLLSKERERYIDLIYKNLKHILNSKDIKTDKWSGNFILGLIYKDNDCDNEEVLRLIEENIERLNINEPILEKYITVVWDKIERNTSIYNNVMSYLNSVESINYKIDLEILKSMFKNESITIETKNTILISQIKYYEKEEISLLLELSKNEDTYNQLYEIINPKKFKLTGSNTRRISNNELNKNILEELKRKGWIKSYKLINKGSLYSIKPA